MLMFKNVGYFQKFPHVFNKYSVEVYEEQPKSKVNNYIELFIIISLIIITKDNFLL